MSLDQGALAELRKDSGSEPARYQTRTGQRRRRWWFAALAVVALVLAWLLLGRSGPLEVRTAVGGPPPPPGSTAVLSASGYIVARRLATVSAKVTGRIASVEFEEGSGVEAGQVLARLDDATARAAWEVASRQRDAARKDLTEVEVRLDEAIRQRDRLRALQADKLVSASALDTAEAEATALAARLEAARASVAVAEGSLKLRAQDLDDLVVRAPFAGVIISKDAQPGEMVSPISAGGGYTRTGIATIVDMDSREIEVDVNEAYINRVREGQRAEAILDAYPDWRIPARVLAIVPTADRQKATVRVRIAIEELDPRILPDMGVKVRFFEDAGAEGPPPLASVPVEAVAGSGDDQHVWTIEDGRARRAAVRAGEESEGQRGILSGIEPGAVVVLDPPAGLEDGSRVRVRDGA
jgi:RND family efflux transporter MFP subunit